MKRPLSIEFHETLKHAASRENARQAIFLNEKYFTDFSQNLNLLAFVKKLPQFLVFPK